MAKFVKDIHRNMGVHVMVFTSDDPRGGTRGKPVTLLPGYDKVREGESDRSRTAKENL